MHMFLGEDAEAPICYYATEPLDNHDLSLFLRDCFFEFQRLSQFTTAVPTRDSECSKRVLRELRKLQLTLHRFSISSINEFQKVMEMFRPEEVLEVIPMPRFPECPKTKLIEIGKVYGKSERTLPAGTIACVSGGVVNMESKTVRLVTPIRACAKFPNGEIIVGIQEFDDADYFIDSRTEDSWGISNRELSGNKIKFNAEYSIWWVVFKSAYRVYYLFIFGNNKENLVKIIREGKWRHVATLHTTF